MLPPCLISQDPISSRASEPSVAIDRDYATPETSRTGRADPKSSHHVHLHPSGGLIGPASQPRMTGHMPAD